MSLIPNNPEVEQPITNDGFFPDINPADFRSSVRIDSAISADPVRHQLKLAIHRVNQDLADYKAARVAEGVANLAAVSADQIDAESVKLFDYRDAVFSFAKALLLETYADTDTTVLADSNTEKKASSADEFKRRSFEAVMRVIGEPRAAVELI